MSLIVLGALEKYECLLKQPGRAVTVQQELEGNSRNLLQAFPGGRVQTQQEQSNCSSKIKEREKRKLNHHCDL